MVTDSKDKPSIFGFLPARNEGALLLDTINSLLNQTLKPAKLLIINDGSTDETFNNLHKLHEQTSGFVDAIHLAYHKESYVSTPALNWKMATVLNWAFNPANFPWRYDYFLHTGADTVFERDYLEKLVNIMEARPKLVVASGMVQGEETLKTHVRGVGRLYKAWFWHHFIGRFPLNYTYESYPLYKARSLGLEVESFPSLVMKTHRATAPYQVDYGLAMRELGYFPPYAIARCLMSIPTLKLKLLMMYLQAPRQAYDEDVKRFLHHHQCKLIINFWKYLGVWRKRI